MLLQLPPDLQQRIVEQLSVQQVAALREVSRDCCDLASRAIRSATLQCAGDVKQMTKAFPRVSQLTLAPETEEERVALSLALQPEQDFQLPPALKELTIDIDSRSFDVFRCFQLSKVVEDCPTLDDIEILAYCVDLTADDHVLQKLTGILATAPHDPPFPPACFLSGGLVNESRLQRCDKLRSLKTYTRSDEDTEHLTGPVCEHPGLEVLELHVPQVKIFTNRSRAYAGSSSVRRLKLIGSGNVGDAFQIDLPAFPSVEFLVVSLRSSHIPDEPVSGAQMLCLKTAWLYNVIDLQGLANAPSLTTLCLDYNNRCGHHPNFASLAAAPNLRRLQICYMHVTAEDLVACRRLEELALVNVIGR